MRIGILTGGGDVPGLNPAIKAVVNRAHDNGWEVYGFRRGWAGLLCVQPDDEESRRETVADYALRDPAEVGRFLENLAR